MKGRRLADATWPDVLPACDGDMRDGDYWFATGSPASGCNAGFDGTWFVYYGGAAQISRHKVIEHDDGTISVPKPGPAEPANSIAITVRGREVFHGWINRGEWHT
jgi:hypothetical protein